MENSGKIEVHAVDYDVGYTIDEDKYDILEATDSRNFEHFKCPDDAISLPRVIVVFIFSTPGWYHKTVKAFRSWNASQKWNMKDMDATWLLCYMEDG